MPDQEWLSKYEQIKGRLFCKVNLESYFSEKYLGETRVDTLGIGAVPFPTGTVFACDPLVSLEECPPYIQKIPAGTYPVTICVVPSEKYGDRYACVKVAVSGRKPVRYELAVTGEENLDETLEEGDFFGFCVDAGMGCVADRQAQEEYRKYWRKRCEEDEDIDPYNDLFSEILEKSYQERPKYQRKGGDWANWNVPGGECHIPVFASGWGDGVYPCYFGYDEHNAVCGVYIWFIDIVSEYSGEQGNP